jgi:hypothetical protein
MAKRGRPRNNGAKPAWVLHRTMLALYGYDKARKAGEKYETALQAGIAEVRCVDPHMAISMTEMKRILRMYRSEAQASTYLVAESEKPITLEGRTYSRVWSMSIGPRPNYPRHNACNGRLSNERTQ